MASTRSWYATSPTAGSVYRTPSTSDYYSTRASTEGRRFDTTEFRSSTIRRIWDVTTSLYERTESSDGYTTSTVQDKITTMTTEISNASSSEAIPPSDTFQSTVTTLYYILAVLGILGNLLVIFIVVRNRKMRTVTNVHILNLSLIDAIIMVGLFFRNNHSWPYSKYYCFLYICATSITDFAGCLQVAALSTDRWFAVCFPMHSNKFRTMRNSILVCVLVWLISIGLSLPLIYNSDLRNSVCSIYWEEYKVMEFAYPFTFGFCLPIIIISLSYTMILLKLRSLGFQDKNSRRIRKVTVFVVVVIGVYLALWIPYWLVVLNTVIFRVTMPATITIVEYISFLYSGLNPLLYAFVNDDFRKYMLSVFTLKTFRKVEVDEDTSTDGPGVKTCISETRLNDNHV